MDKELRDQIIEILGAADHMTLATIRADGFPQATTVSFANEGLIIGFGCRDRSQKATNLTHNHRVSLSITLPFKSWAEIRGLSAGGLAERLVDKNEAKKWSTLLLQRSPESAEFAQHALVGVTFFKIAPKVITVLDYRKGIGYATSVTIPGPRP